MWTGDGSWSYRDNLLVLALELFEQSIDPDCGHSSYLAGDADYDGHYRMGERKCMACKAIDNWRETPAGKKKPGKGVKHYLWMKLFNPNGGDDG
jgi:hypothetical protein